MSERTRGSYDDALYKLTYTLLYFMLTADPYTALTILPTKTPKITKTKLASVSVHCKSRRFKTANPKIYLQILSTKSSFYIYSLPLTDMNVTASFHASNLQTNY